VNQPHKAKRFAKKGIGKRSALETSESAEAWMF
jgi:hypothetical protein